MSISSDNLVTFVINLGGRVDDEAKSVYRVGERRRTSGLKGQERKKKLKRGGFERRKGKMEGKEVEGRNKRGKERREG